MPELRIPCTIVRGGTSKALIFLASDLPRDLDARARVILRAFGSPDVRQVDGLGGADPLTSKVAVLAPSTRKDVDVEYTFGQVGIREAFIDWSGNCGNISSAVGPFALEHGLARATEPVSRVRILNTNTGKMIVSEVPVRGGRVVTDGGYRIDGVPGTGAEIRLHFLDPGGVATGKLLPTGNVIDCILLENGSAVEATLVDAGNPTGFVEASQLGLRGSECPDDIEGKAVGETLEEIRAKFAERMGLVASWREAFGRFRTYPKIAYVSPPAEFNTLNGARISADNIDFQARVMAMGKLHKAFALTAAIPAAAASRIRGSVVNRVCSAQSRAVRIGHPSGVLALEVTAHEENGNAVIDEVSFGRTARTLMEGVVYVPCS